MPFRILPCRRCFGSDIGRDCLQENWFLASSIFISDLWSLDLVLFSAYDSIIGSFDQWWSFDFLIGSDLLTNEDLLNRDDLLIDDLCRW